VGDMYMYATLHLAMGERKTTNVSILDN